MKKKNKESDAKRFLKLLLKIDTNKEDYLRIYKGKIKEQMEIWNIHK